MSYKLIPNEIEGYPLEDLILHFTSQKWLNVAVSREMDLRWGVGECFIFLPLQYFDKNKGGGEEYVIWEKIQGNPG